MRVAVLGCGSIGRRHIGNLLALGCDVYGYDPNIGPRTYAAELHPKARIFGLLGGDERFDAWVIATPYDQHLYFAELAIAKRIPFFVEKPLGSLEQLPRWRQLSRMALPINQVGYQCRFHPKAYAMNALSALVSPVSGQFWCDVDMRTWPGQAYGPMLLECSHDLDLALSLGAPATVDEAVAYSPHDVALWLGNWRVAVRSQATAYSRHWSVMDGRGSGLRFHFTAPAELGDQMYQDALAHFLACVRDGTPTICPFADGLRVLDVCTQVNALTRQAA